MIQTIKQNAIQKELISFARIFKNDKQAIVRAENKGLSIYTPKLNKARVGASIGLFLILLILPLVPDFIFIPKLLKWGIQ